MVSKSARDHGGIDTFTCLPSISTQVRVAHFYGVKLMVLFVALGMGVGTGGLLVTVHLDDAMTNKYHRFVIDLSSPSKERGSHTEE